MALDLSVVIPVYNEAPNLAELYRELTETLRPSGLSYELLFIDDGSTDEGFTILAGIQAGDARVRVVRFRRNFGQTAAFSANPTLPTPVDSPLVATASPSHTTGKCTYTYFYWRTHPDAWLIENIVIGPLSYDQAQAIAILESNELDARTLLLQQFFAALLNSLSGADAAVIQATLKQASDWISTHPSESLIAESDRAQAMTLVLALTDYNTGVSGPGHCPDEPYTPTPQPTPTITQTPTRTPAPTSTRRPATPTSEDDGGGGSTKAPTEPQPTDNPTDQPTQPPKPTDKPTPKPTDRPTPPVPTPEPPTWASTAATTR